MTAASRRIAITRKISLTDFADGWDDAYVVATLASYQEKVDLQAKDITGMDNVAGLAFEVEICRKHFVAGKLYVLKDDSSSELVDMVVDDVAQLPIEAVNHLYLTIMGVTLDPKATQTATEPSPTLPATSEPSNNESSTKTS